MRLVLGKQYMHFFDRYWGWYNAPVFVGLIYLEFRRTLHQKYNLIAVGNARVQSRSSPIQQLDALRCVSGKFNSSTAGGPSEADTFFGRNIMPQVQTDKVRIISHDIQHPPSAQLMCIFLQVWRSQHHHWMPCFYESLPDAFQLRTQVTIIRRF